MARGVKKHRARKRKGRITISHIERSLHENYGLEKWMKRQRKKVKKSKKVKK